MYQTRTPIFENTDEREVTGKSELVVGPEVAAEIDDGDRKKARKKGEARRDGIGVVAMLRVRPDNSKPVVLV